MKLGPIGNGIGFGVLFAVLRVFHGEVESPSDLGVAFVIGFGVAATGTYLWRRFVAPGSQNA